MERARCDAIKQSDGERCTRFARGGGRRCTQHSKVGAAALVTTADREPWTALGMPQPHAKNDRRALQKLRAKLRAPLPASQNNEEEEGYIYVYGIAGERALNYWKVGMTARADAHARVDEWRRAHNKRHAVVLRGQFHTRHPKRVERVIHLYLAYCRMYRYEYEEEIGNGTAVSGAVSKFHSVWARDGAVVEDGQQLEAPTPHALAATRKHVEWFCEEYAHIRGVIESVILGTTLQCAREARTASPARSSVQIL